MDDGGGKGQTLSNFCGRHSWMAHNTEAMHACIFWLTSGGTSSLNLLGDREEFLDIFKTCIKNNTLQSTT